MKCSVNCKQLLSALIAATKVIGKPVLQILGNLRVELNDDGNLSVMGSDSEIIVKVICPSISAQGVGVFCTDAKRIVDLFKNMPIGEVTLEHNPTDNILVVSHDNGSFQLPCVDASQFPTSVDNSNEGETKTFVLDAAEITEALDRVKFAMAPDVSLHPHMAGVYWDVKPDYINFVATDTRVLARFRRMIDTGIECDFILPSKVTNMLGYIIGQDKSIMVTVSPRAITFQGKSSYCRVNKLNYKYPQYERVIPKNCDKHIVVERAALERAVSRVAVCSEGEKRICTLEIANDNINVSVRDLVRNIGGLERVHCEYQGEPISIGFNISYLRDVFATSSFASASLSVNTAKAPVLVKPNEASSPSELIFVLAPMSI